MLTEENKNLLRRAVRLMKTQTFGPISENSATKYREIAANVERQMLDMGDEWRGVSSLTETQRYAYLMRAAWSRHTHQKVVQAIDDLRSHRVSDEAGLQSLELWVPEAERCPPLQPKIPGTVSEPGEWLARLRAEGIKPSPSRSKRRGILELPDDWLNQLWRAAGNRDFVHLDALAVLIATGCRPAEVCAGVLVENTSEGLALTITGAKTNAENGQPWRRLVIGLDDDVALHLSELADNGPVIIKAECSPVSLTTSISQIGKVAGFERTISAYDIRHQRCADVRNTLSTIEDVAAWLGHASETTSRYYGKAPKSSGCRGPRPVAVSAARPVRTKTRRLVNKIAA